MASTFTMRFFTFIYLFQVALSAPPPEPPELPKSFTTFIMWNIAVDTVEENGKEPTHAGFTLSILENCDTIRERAAISIFSEVDFTMENITRHQKVIEKVIWRPLQIHGVDRFLSLTNLQSSYNIGWTCVADKLSDDSYFRWLFGFDFNCQENCGFPSIANMLHWGDKNYTYTQDMVVNGIEVNEYVGRWNVPAWNADFKVKYYWSDVERWESSSGKGKSVPVSVVIEGEATIDGKKYNLKMNMDYTNFFEVDMGIEYFDVPTDIWCEGRRMEDKLPSDIPNQFSYDSEISFIWSNGARTYLVVSERSNWYDREFYVSRTDYKPPNVANPENPFDGKTREVSEVQDYITGLAYTIDKGLGNCSIGYLAASDVGDMIDDNGYIHMKSPLDVFYLNGSFAFNGETAERGIYLDAYIKTGPQDLNDPESVNYTTVVYLSGSKIEENSMRYIPTKVVQYATKDYNKISSKVTLNIAGFVPMEPDFDVFDVSYCFKDQEDQKLPILIRMGWTSEMDLEGSLLYVSKEVRRQVMTWAKVTAIRVANIQYSIDEKSNAFFILFNLLGFPPGFSISQTELPDAVRANSEAVDLLTKAVDEGYFKVAIPKKFGDGIVLSQAEHGSLSKGGVYKVGYSGGAMAGLGISMLLIAGIGCLVLFVYVIKW